MKPQIIAFGAIGLLSVAAIASSVSVIEPSTVGVERSMGHLEPQVLKEGPHVIAPWASVVIVPVHQGYFTVNLTDAQSKDKLKMAVSVTFQFRKNPDMQVKMYHDFRNDDDNSILKPAAMSALRQAMSVYTSEEAVGDKRDDFTLTIQRDFEAAIQSNLMSNGFSEADARLAYIIPRVQLQAVTPPERIMAANAEMQASKIDLERQRTLTEIAERQSERQKMQGEGVNKLFNELPKGYTSKDVYNILAAITLKENADSFYRAVESGKVSIYPVPQQNPIALPAQ